MKNRFERHPRATLFSLSFLFLCLFLLIDHYLAHRLFPVVHGVQHHYYHHGYPANYRAEYGWGDSKHVFISNSLGFKDSSNAVVPLSIPKTRILFIGDSFTEGMGYPFDKTFVGMLRDRFIRQEFDVLNAGVASYSPKLYYNKIKYLLEEAKLRFDKVVCYIDISDVQDEINYKSFEPGPPPTLMRILRTWLDRNSLVYRTTKVLFADLARAIDGWRAPQPSKSEAVAKKEAKYNEQFNKLRGDWTLQAGAMKAVGNEGLDLATHHMELLHELLKKHGITLTIAVYPWPQQIKAKDLDSIQVTHWSKFARERGIGFINYFPSFIDRPEPIEQVIRENFIAGDVHWNEKGHELIAKGFCSRQMNAEAKLLCKL